MFISHGEILREVLCPYISLSNENWTPFSVVVPNHDGLFAKTTDEPFSLAQTVAVLSDSISEAKSRFILSQLMTKDVNDDLSGFQLWSLEDAFLTHYAIESNQWRDEVISALSFALCDVLVFATGNTSSLGTIKSLEAKVITCVSKRVQDVVCPKILIIFGDMEISSSHISEMLKTWEIYFSRIFVVKKIEDVNIIIHNFFEFRSPESPVVQGKLLTSRQWPYFVSLCAQWINFSSPGNFLLSIRYVHEYARALAPIGSSLNNWISALVLEDISIEEKIGFVARLWGYKKIKNLEDVMNILRNGLNFSEKFPGLMGLEEIVESRIREVSVNNFDFGNDRRKLIRVFFENSSKKLKRRLKYWKFLVSSCPCFLCGTMGKSEENFLATKSIEFCRVAISRPIRICDKCAEYLPEEISIDKKFPAKSERFSSPKFLQKQQRVTRIPNPQGIDIPSTVRSPQDFSMSSLSLCGICGVHIAFVHEKMFCMALPCLHSFCCDCLLFSLRHISRTFQYISSTGVVMPSGSLLGRMDIALIESTRSRIASKNRSETIEAQGGAWISRCPVCRENISLVIYVNGLLEKLVDLEIVALWAREIGNSFES